MRGRGRGEDHEEWSECWQGEKRLTFLVWKKEGTETDLVFCVEGVGSSSSLVELNCFRLEKGAPLRFPSRPEMGLIFRGEILCPWLDTLWKEGRPGTRLGLLILEVKSDAMSYSNWMMVWNKVQHT